MQKLISLLSICLIAAQAARAEVHTYTIDPVHSGITFKVRHFFNKVPGTFNQFKGTVVYDAENPANNKANAVIEVPSVDTRNEKRDGHLQNEDFFNVPQYPLIEFTSTEWIPAGVGKYTVKGMLTMVGVAKEVTLDVTFLGEMEARGKMISGWEGSTVINRDDWGITYGKPAVGEEVDIELNIQAAR